MSKPIRRIGVLTGGGDCPGLNAVIRSVTKTAINKYQLEVMGIEDAFLGLLENRIRPLNYDDVSNILTTGGTILGSSNRCNPERVAVKQPDGSYTYENRTDIALKHIAEHKLDALIVIGGDGTMSGAANFVRHGINCIGVPKTIDNDLVGTDVTFGFGTARYVCTDALDRLHTTAASHHRAMVLEVMGRNAGWLALHSGVAGGADVILIPEIPFHIDAICDHVNARSKRGRRFTILCISEGAKPAGGEQIVKELDPTSPDPVKLGGVGNVVADLIEERTGVASRCTVLGHVQRGGSPIPEDRVLGTEFGHAAIEALMAGKQNRLVVMQGRTTTDVDILRAENQQRTVPVDHPLIAAARAVGTCMGDE